MIYAGDGLRPTVVRVPTATHPTRDGPGNPSYPSFEAFLGSDGRLHETWVTCQDATGREHRFLVAAQYCAGSEVNVALKGVLPEVEWKGGLIVMRGGCRSFVVHMGDSVMKSLAHAAVHKYVLTPVCNCGQRMADVDASRFLFETAPLVAHSNQHNAPLEIPVKL